MSQVLACYPLRHPWMGQVGLCARLAAILCEVWHDSQFELCSVGILSPGSCTKSSKSVTATFCLELAPHLWISSPDLWKLIRTRH